MKKILFFAAVLATALVSCSSDDSNALNEGNVNKVPTQTEVKALSIKAAGTTLAVAPTTVQSRSVEGNSVAFAAENDDAITITLNPILAEGVTAYTCSADGFTLKYKPYHKVKKDNTTGHTYAPIDTLESTCHATNYITVNKAMSISVTDLDKMHQNITVHADSLVDEWTYEIMIYPQVVGAINEATGLPAISNPLVNIMESTDYDLGNLLGIKPNPEKIVKVSASTHTDRWGNTYTTDAYQYSQYDPVVVENSKYKVAVMVYQGQCNVRANKNNPDYNYSYIKASITVTEKPAAE